MKNFNASYELFLSISLMHMYHAYGAAVKLEIIQMDKGPYFFKSPNLRYLHTYMIQTSKESRSYRNGGTGIWGFV